MSYQTSLNKKDALSLVLLALAGLGVRLYFLQFYDVISADGISYVSIARDFMSGRGLASATHYPPFFPILLGLASTFTHDFETAGLAVSVVMGSLLVVPVYLLGVEFFDRRVGAMAAFLSVTWPTLRFWSTAVMSQATYITLLLLGVYFLWRGYKNSAWIPAALGGVFFGCAHMTRSEGVLVLLACSAALVLATLVNKLPLKRLLYVGLTIAVFFAVFSPYLVLLHEITGKWQLTGKSKVAIADALSEYLRRPDIKHDPAFQEIGYLDLFRLYPGYVRTNYLKNLATCWREMLPVYGWLLAFLGLCLGAFKREKLLERVYLLGTFAPLPVIIVFFFIGPEYTQPYLPVLFLFTGNALSAGGSFLAVRTAALPGGVARYACGVPVLLAFLYGSWMVVREVPADRGQPYQYTRDGGRFDEKRIGQRLAKTLPADAVIMTRSGRIGFYSGRRYVTPPQTDYAGIIVSARKGGVGFLVVTPQLANVRPQLAFLFDPVMQPERPFTPPPELELLGVGQEPGGIPYMLYRFR